MAAMSPLRRWKRFVEAFRAVDDAIEAAPEGCCSRRRYREVWCDILEMLCNAAGDAEAEGLCQLLDEVMVESLETLRVVAMTPTILTTTGVVKAVGDRRNHQAEEVRGLACSIFGGWRTSIQAAFKQLSEVPPPEHEALSAPVAATAVQEDKKQAAKVPEPVRPKKMSPGVSTAAAGELVRSEQSTAGDGKRKSPDGASGAYYRESESDDVKRQRKVSETADQRPRKTHSACSKERSRASCWRSRHERRFSTSSSLRHRV